MVYELVLVENGKSEANRFYDQHHPKADKVEEIKAQPKRLLGSNFKEYFQDVKKFNLSEIVEGFDQHQFISKLKENNEQISKYWNSWKIEAEEDRIEVVCLSLLSC